ncbi:MAG: hypothetical protein HY328_10895 [Chloroflexi bacterium]|nr:hypothetical protein [Chloroflexota bacterium]
MAVLTLSAILDDLQVAEAGLHKFERRFWVSSAHFYEMYSQGRLDDGAHSEAFAEWAGHYKLKLKREAALEQLSRLLSFAITLLALPTTLLLLPGAPIFLQKVSDYGQQTGLAG